MNFEKINYSDFDSKESYPEVTIQKREECTYPLIINAYAGSKGELNASCQYIYQSFIVKNEYKHLYKILEEIAIVEMKHLEILSQVIIAMNGDPKYCRYIDNNPNICDNWSTKNIAYIKNIQEFIEYNIALENGAIREYERIIEISENENLKDIISRIIQDEKIHLKIFTMIYEITCGKVREENEDLT